MLTPWGIPLPTKQPFRTEVKETEDLWLSGYDEKKMLLTFYLLLLLLLCTAILVPTALLSYHVVSYPVGVAIVIGFCILFICIIQILELDRPEIQIFLVLGYCGIATTILSNFR